MDDRQNRVLMTLAVALIALVAFLVLVKAPEESGDEKVSWTKLFPDAHAEDVDHFSLVRGDTLLRFGRDELRWTVQSGDRAPVAADTDRVEDLLDAAIKAEVAEDDRDPTVADLAAFGLDAPVASLTIALKTGAELSLRVGLDAPVGYSTYVMSAESGPVQHTRSKLTAITAGDLSLDGFRSKEAMKLDRGDVQQVRLSRPASADEPALAVVLDHDAHGWWVAPEHVRADDRHVSDLLADLGTLEVDGFLPADTAMTDPVSTIEVVQAAQTLSVTLGAVVEGERVARVPNFDVPVRLGDALDGSLARESRDWWATGLMPVRSADASSIEARLGDQKLSATRDADGWNADASAFLDALRAVRVDRSVTAPAPTGEAWGEIRLAEEPAGGEAVRLFQALADGGRVAVDEAGGPAFIVPTTELGRLTESLPRP